MMKMQIAFWIALLFTSCATSDTLFDKATELENQGNYADSLNQAYHDFNYCIEQQYETVESLYWRAYTYWKAGKEAEAYLDFVSVIRFGEEDDRRVTEAKNKLENLNIDKKKK